MDDKPTDRHIERRPIGQNLPSASSEKIRNCLFTGPELIVILLLLFAAVLLVEIKGFDSPMIYDSEGWIVGNSHVFAKRQPLAVAEIVPERPLFLLSLYVNYVIHGMDPAYFRVFNGLILAGAGVALMVMLNMIMLLHPSGIVSSRGAARAIIFLIGLLFVLHPLQVFAVLYIWQREALLACLFYFSALAIYAAGRSGAVQNSVVAYSLTTLVFFLGLLSKENVITLPAMILLLDFIFFKQSPKEFSKRAVITGFVALIPFLVYLFLAYHLHGPESVSAKVFQRLSQYFQESGISPLNVILTEPRVWFLYLVSIAAPSVGGLHLVRAMEVSTSLFHPPVTALACLGVVGLASIGFALRTREPLVSFGLLFFCVALLPESLLLPQYLFCGYRAILPMAGLLLILARGLIFVSTVLSRERSSSVGKAGLAGAMCIYAVYLGMTTHSIASRWGPLWIWEHSANALPEYSSGVEISPYADIIGNYGIELMISGDHSGAIKPLRQGVEMQAAARRPYSQARLLFALGHILTLEGNREEAMKRFKQAIQANPRWPPPYNRLGALFLQAGDAPAALDIFKKAVILNPSLPISHYSVGTTLLMMGDTEHGVQSLQKALELKPNYPEASANLGKALLNLNRPREAVHHLKTAISAFPHDAELRRALATAYQNLGMSQEAEQQLKRAFEIRPHLPEAGRNPK